MAKIRKTEWVRRTRDTSENPERARPRKQERLESYRRRLCPSSSATRPPPCPAHRRTRPVVSEPDAPLRRHRVRPTGPYRRDPTICECLGSDDDRREDVMSAAQRAYTTTFREKEAKNTSRENHRKTETRVLCSSKTTYHVRRQMHRHGVRRILRNCGTPVTLPVAACSEATGRPVGCPNV
jgi:hypothetical protein